jgi:dihydrofolate reductase
MKNKLYLQISFIAAMTPQRVIGQKNQLPWRLPADLKRFKAITLKKPVIMGRKTHESIGFPLPKRLNIIMTTDLNYHAPNCQIAHSIEAALELAHGFSEVFVIGGASVYQAFLPFVKRLYITIVDADIEGDVFFPLIDLSNWRLISRENHAPDEKNSYPYSFCVWERKSRRY